MKMLGYQIAEVFFHDEDGVLVRNDDAHKLFVVVDDLDARLDVANHDRHQVEIELTDLSFCVGEVFFGNDCYTYIDDVLNELDIRVYMQVGVIPNTAEEYMKQKSSFVDDLILPSMSKEAISKLMGDEEE